MYNIMLSSKDERSKNINFNDRSNCMSLTLREECRLRVSENRILRRIFGPKRDENGEWRTS